MPGMLPVINEECVKQAIRTASQSLRHVEWFEVTDIRGHVADGEVAHFQVGVKLGFRLERDGA